MTDEGEAGGVGLELDCRGLPCPAPVIELARHVTDVEVGGRIAVLVTDVAARTDIPAWCRMTGHELIAEQRSARGDLVLVVRRCR